jgi:hypothetical protein
MNRKAFQLTISTLILFIIGIALLIGLIYLLTDGFKSFKQTSDPLAGSTQEASIKQACKIACDSESKLTFCCREHDLEDIKVKCTDSILEIDCNQNATKKQRPIRKNTKKAGDIAPQK